MHLKKIEMQGFKSFADKTSIELQDGITTIVGPNGSGKSNISDAIRWVLGEQSVKSLRGTKSSDLVFTGTQNRKSLGFAQVSLIFDNTDQTLPIEYSEVKITRRIYRTGEVQIYINENIARLKDVTELFLDTGIGKDGYSIIGQGRVEEIISSKSEDRRHIFDEAAGIEKYRYRKDESEKKLERTKLNLLRITDILDEIQSSIGPLYEQSEKAKKYLKLKEEIKLKDTNLIKVNIDKLKGEVQTLAKEKQQTDTSLGDESSKLNNLNLVSKDTNVKIKELEDSIEKINENNYRLKSQIEKNNSQIELNKTKIANCENNIKTYSVEIEEIKNLIEKNKAEIEQKENKKKIYSKDKEKFENKLRQLEQEYNEIYSKMDKSKKEKERIKEEIESLKEEKYQLEIAKTVLDTNLLELEKQLKELEKQEKDSLSKQERIKINNEDNLKVFNNLKKQYDESLEDIKKQKNNVLEKEIELNKLKEEQKQLEVKLNKQKTSFKLLKENEQDNEGYQKGVKELLEKKQLIGTVAKLIKVEDKYLQAMEVVLGNKAQNIITKDKNEAKALIKYLKSEKLGRATFLPLDSLEVKKLKKEDYVLFEGFIDIANNLVTIDKKYQVVIDFLLGTFVVVDNIDNAINLQKTFKNIKIVTLDGDFLAPEGSMTGGFKMQNKMSILGRQNRIKIIEKDILELEKALVKLNVKIEEQNTYLNNLKEKLQVCEEEKDNLKIEYAKCEEKNKYIILDIEKYAKQREKAKKQSEEKQREIKNIKGEILKYNEQIEQKQKEIEQKTIDISQIKIEDEDKINLLKEDLSDVKISLNSIIDSQKSIDEIVTLIKEDILKNENKKKEYLTKIEQYNLEIANLKEEIEKLKQKSQTDNVLNENELKQLQDLKENKKQLEKQLQNLNEQINGVKTNIEIIKENKLKLDNKMFRLDEQINIQITKLWDEYEMTPNNIENVIEITNIAKVQKEIQEQKEQVRSLGEININAIEEYKVQKQRVDFMTEQKTDLEETISKLKGVINEIVQNMKIQFDEKFKEINKNFQEVFVELFGGGYANLSLEDEKDILNSGIEIKVQPPGKKLQNMNLLSGGEKALTAISILFAILKINPSPFCVLDEIEAALDDVNVFRFANFVKKLTSDTQFLIITHRKGTMEIADNVYGVTMEEKGISKLLSLKL